MNSCLCTSSSYSKFDHDNEYWQSVSREKYLRDAGLNNAADMERNSRQQYMRGKGYHSPNGGRQIHYNGSKEQQRDLNAIDEYARSHPEF